MDELFTFHDAVITSFTELVDNYTGRTRYNAVYTVTIGELIEAGVFSWESEYLNWSDAAISEEQYKRVCDYFVSRFMFREISMLPYKKWALMLRNKLVYELMPKYKNLYLRFEEGINPLASENTYHKRREIESNYPETLLSENADYISHGQDEEYQTIRESGFVDALNKYGDAYKGIDEMMLDELEYEFFISLFTANVNACW